jgi:hypothetical protein
VHLRDCFSLHPVFARVIVTLCLSRSVPVAIMYLLLL